MTDEYIVAAVAVGVLVIALLWIWVPWMRRRSFERGFEAGERFGRRTGHQELTPEFDFRWPVGEQADADLEAMDRGIQAAQAEIEAEGYQRVGKFEWQRSKTDGYRMGDVPVPKAGGLLPRSWTEYLSRVVTPGTRRG